VFTAFSCFIRRGVIILQVRTRRPNQQRRTLLLNQHSVGTREKELHAIHGLVLHIRAIETCPIRHESTGINQNINRVSQQLIFKTCFISFFRIAQQIAATQNVCTTCPPGNPPGTTCFIYIGNQCWIQSLYCVRFSGILVAPRQRPISPQSTFATEHWKKRWSIFSREGQK